MNSIDNTIKYYELLMKYDNTSKYIKSELPKGYHFEFYKDNDLDEWINIHISSGEFTSKLEGKKIFYQFYSSFIDELDKRCFFIVEDETNIKVATATVSLLKEKEFGYDSTIDWLAIRKDYQGKKLSKPLISKVIETANSLGHISILLHTQTTTWLAAKLYLDYGFEILNDNTPEGWEILKAITKHKKLDKFRDIKFESIFDKRNILIKNKLEKIYGTDNFNYSIWYKDGLHNVYVYCNGILEEYEYFEKNLDIELVKLENKFECKIATLDDIEKRETYLINIHDTEKENWIQWKKERIKQYKNNEIIIYYGLLDGKIIAEATANISESIENDFKIINGETVYLSAFRVDKKYEGNGYFSKLYNFMENDIREKNYKYLTIAVEPDEKRNIQIYKHYGFTEKIKSDSEVYPNGKVVVIDYFRKKLE